MKKVKKKKYIPTTISKTKYSISTPTKSVNYDNYNKLAIDLNYIRVKFNELNNKYPEVINNLKTSIFIDNHTINEDNLNYINNDNIRIANELTDIVIPSIKNKMY